jgi:F-box/leucine-rich repeat protein 10/11
MQQNTWLGDMCDEVRRVVLIEGDTMIIPAGYIHAVVSGHCFVGQDELIR